MDKITKLLKVDLIKHRLDEKMFKRYIKGSLLEIRNTNPDPAIFCSVCSYFKFVVSFNIAIEKNISVILGGYDKSQSVRPVIQGSDHNNEVIFKRYVEIGNIFHKVLNNQFRNTVYDFGYDKYKNEQLPQIILPITFLKNYSRNKATSTLLKAGISNKIIDYMSGGCDALGFFNLLSFRWYGFSAKAFETASLIRNYNQGFLSTDDSDKLTISYCNALERNHKFEDRKSMACYIKTIEDVSKFNSGRGNDAKKFLIFMKKSLPKIKTSMKRIPFYAKYFDIDL